MSTWTKGRPSGATMSSAQRGWWIVFSGLLHGLQIRTAGSCIDMYLTFMYIS